MSEPTCLILRGDKEIYASERRGIAPLIELIESGQEVKGCTAYDKIVGKAAALLYAVLGVAEVRADVLSKKAAGIFQKYRIAFCYKTLAKSIINRAGDGVCPMEQTVENIDDPQKAFPALKAKMKQLQAK